MVNLKKNFEDALEFANNKVCILRCDLNLPIIDGEVTDFTRLDKVLPTLKMLLARNSKILLISHLGRPKGKFDENLSLKIILPHLEKRLGKKIFFAKEDLMKSNEIENKIKKLDVGNVLLIENIRFYKQEEQNEVSFSKKLASFGDIYINESFASSHREHSSITGIATFLPSFPGKLFQHELKNLNYIIKNLQTASSIAVLGGSKISTKIEIIENLSRNFDKLLIGGAMANTFLSAAGYKIGKSLNEPDMISKAKLILKKFKDKIMIPQDVIVITLEENGKNAAIDVKNISENHIIYDIGPKTRKDYYNEILKHEKLLWNGPLGFFEKKPFDNGTNYVSSIVRNHKNKSFFSIAGGGDTISAMKNSGNMQYFSFISTAGGAFLEFIEGKSLPGIEILNN